MPKQTPRRIMFAYHVPRAQDVANGLITPKLTPQHRNRSLRCGKDAEIMTANIPAALREPDRLMVVLVTGHHQQEWITLGHASEAAEITPFGVVMLTRDEVVWKRLSEYAKLRFVANASGINSLLNEQRFPWLQDTARFLNTDPTNRLVPPAEQIAQLLMRVAETDLPQGSSSTHTGSTTLYESRV